MTQTRNKFTSAWSPQRLTLSRWLYSRVFVIDGSFTAVHLRQKHPENDVFLSDGTGYMTSRKPYLKHLNAMESWVEVSLNTLRLDDLI